ncbi:conserved hypothetical protein [Coccidioides posadasii str. Silveira]|uniref:Uncharacterized protein n=1 Tax=Coccidioides posadasii (strain RMSCC 757 / Silveira) TaxID=443226 RepID=E9CWW8_COCPS|nr:conserved hypothetical protein [Coccidioides posadasii str. Silveira]
MAETGPTPHSPPNLERRSTSWCKIARIGGGAHRATVSSPARDYLLEVSKRVIQNQTATRVVAGHAGLRATFRPHHRACKQSQKNVPPKAQPGETKMNHKRI